MDRETVDMEFTAVQDALLDLCDRLETAERHGDGPLDRICAFRHSPRRKIKNRMLAGRTQYIETNFADRIPDGGSGGWGISYDLVEGNAVRPGAKARANDHVLRAAEAFAALALVRNKRSNWRRPGPRRDSGALRRLNDRLYRASAG